MKYGIGNGFPAHHDYHEDDIYRMSGPRILTFFLFFSDVSDGGEREFVDLDIRKLFIRYIITSILITFKS